MKLTPREPTQDMVEAERVKFEAWCDAEGIDASYWLRCDKHTGYENGQTADYWTGWKARARHDAAWNAAAAHAQGLRERIKVLEAQRVPLTKAEITACCNESDTYKTGVWMRVHETTLERLVRAIERAHGVEEAKN